MRLRGKKTEQNYDLTGYSFLGLEVRCQSSVMRERAEETEHTSATEREVELCGME